jgi:hypothetical protein
MTNRLSTVGQNLLEEIGAVLLNELRRQVEGPLFESSPLHPLRLLKTRLQGSAENVDVGDGVEEGIHFPYHRQEVSHEERGPAGIQQRRQQT